MQRSNLIQQIEAQLGKPLSPQQKQQIGQAATETREGMTAAQETFVQDVARISGIAADRIRPMMPQIGQPNATVTTNIIPRLESMRGGALTQEQRNQIIQADNNKKQTMQPIQDNFVQQVSEITGLSADKIKAMLPPVQR